MDAKELRILNFLDFSGTAIAINAGFICDFDYSQRNPERQDAVDFDNVKPIPLDEEWLLRFGWKKIDKYTFNLKGWFIYNRKRGLVTGSKNREIKLESVHQFQNWWFGNNNYDLEIN